MTQTELDTELRTNLRLMSDTFDKIILDAGVPMGSVPDVDLTTTQDFAEMGEMLLGKLSAIENYCESAASSMHKKYDARMIQDKISVKKKILSQLESENCALVATAKRQERALKKMNASSNGNVVEAQQNLMKLKNQLQAAQKEIKILDERKHDLLTENRRLKGQIQAHQKVSSVSSFDEFGEKDTDEAIQLLKEKEAQLQQRKEREKHAYIKRMSALKLQKNGMVEAKSNLEQKIKEKEMQLRLIHDTSKRPIGYRR